MTAHPALLTVESEDAMIRTCEACRQPIPAHLRRDARHCSRGCRNRATAIRRTRYARLGAAVARLSPA